MIRHPKRTSGFTLIELSMVLVIIGLIIGGVLVGQDLIKAAAARSTLAQLDKYQQAVAAFKGKFGALPGDVRDPDATNFGFLPRGNYAGGGDGNGVIEGLQGCPGCNSGTAYLTGENGAFWVDLSAAKMIPNKFNSTAPTYPGINVPNTMLANYIPQADIGRGNYIYVDSGFQGVPNNYFGLSGVLSIGTVHVWEMYNSTKLTVREAYNMDKKVDDGMPQSGNVVNLYYDYNLANHAGWSSGNGSAYLINPGYSLAASAYTCGDNGGNASNPQQYSLTQNNGAGMNCALHFKMHIQ